MEIGLDEVGEEPDEVVATPAGFVFPALGRIHAETSETGVNIKIVLKGDDLRCVDDFPPELRQYWNRYLVGTGGSYVVGTFDPASQSDLGLGGANEDGREKEAREKRGTKRTHGKRGSVLRVERNSSSRLYKLLPGDHGYLFGPGEWTEPPRLKPL